MPERRFNQDEVAAIFEYAAKAQPTDARARSTSDGMTLAHVQEIAREVGIAPDTIAHAAAVIDQRGTQTSRRLLGLPIGVGRTVDLPRKLTDEEWERLVADLRETFDARGVMRSEGSMRYWANGNLQAMLEPTVTAQRLRLRTIKRSAFGAVAIGAAIVGYVALGVLVGTIQGGASDTRDAAVAITIAVAGLGAIAGWMARLPAWARTRREQMEAIAARLTAYLRENS
jgi:hypothetical protein